MFKRILIANRGEIAMRIMKSAKKLGIETVAVYSQADASSPHRRFADRSVCLGPGQSSQSYLNMEAILQTALQNECQAIHPGYGFLSENPLFAELCEQYKITFIGPAPSAIRRMGDKAGARESMSKAGLDIIPGSGIVASLEDARRIAKDIGFPVLLKASAGGGGRGMRLCQSAEQLDNQFAEASREAEKAFGNPDLYIERYLERTRHVEFQILADNFGNVLHLGERECSVQRRHQKLIEESPSPALDNELRSSLGNRVLKAMQYIGYRNAGTLEMLMDEEHRQLYFMEMNKRIQVEHPVTEMITGLDIVEQQIKIAANHMLDKSQKDIRFQGHAIECRINAEDPANNFQPQPGKITKFQVPPEPAEGKIRLDTFVEEGYQIPPFYDSMICKVIVWSDTRAKALEIMEKSLKSFVIEGIPTTIPFALRILQEPSFRQGHYHTQIVEEMLGQKQ